MTHPLGQRELWVSLELADLSKVNTFLFLIRILRIHREGPYLRIDTTKQVSCFLWFCLSNQYHTHYSDFRMQNLFKERTFVLYRGRNDTVSIFEAESQYGSERQPCFFNQHSAKTTLPYMRTYAINFWLWERSRANVFDKLITNSVLHSSLHE